MRPENNPDYNQRQIMTMLKRIDSKLSALLKEEKKKETKTWVNTSIIQHLTGWNSNWMRKARENGLVKYRETGPKGKEYLLESIHPKFLKQDT